MGSAGSKETSTVILLKHSPVKSLSVGMSLPTDNTDVAVLRKSNAFSERSFSNSPPMSPPPNRRSYRLSEEIVPLRHKTPQTRQRATISAILPTRSSRLSSLSEWCHLPGQIQRRCARRSTKINLEISRPAEKLFRADKLPSQVTDLLVFLAREGIAVPDIFRRSGSSQDMKRILRHLRDGIPIVWTNYSFYTLANVAKRFLLSVAGGILGFRAERALIDAMKLPSKEESMTAMHKVILALPLAVQCLLVLLFGIWFRMMYHTEVNSMSLEAVAKSVAGSVFVNNCTTLLGVTEASNVMQFLIANFPSSSLFGTQLLHYFTQQTKTSIVGIERFHYTYQYPTNVPREKCIREFVKLLKVESDRHSFDLLRDVVSEEEFEAAEGNCILVVENRDPKSSIDSTRQSTDVPSENFNQNNEKHSTTIAPILLRRLVSRHEDKPMNLSSEPPSESNFSLTFKDDVTAANELFKQIQGRQLDRLKQRSEWFSGTESPQPSITSPRHSSLCSTTTPDSPSFLSDNGVFNDDKSPSSTNSVLIHYKEETVCFVVRRFYGPV